MIRVDWTTDAGAESQEFPETDEGSTAAHRLFERIARLPSTVKASLRAPRAEDEFAERLERRIRREARQ